MSEQGVGFKVYADASAFERGMAQVERTAASVGKKVAHSFDGRAIGHTLATALGLSLHSIAEKVARFWTGFSTEAESALEAMVAATGKAADAQERALEKLRAQKQKQAEDAAEQGQKEYDMLRNWRDKANADDRAAAQERENENALRVTEEYEIEQAKKAQTEEAIKAARIEGRQAQLAGERAAEEAKVTREKEQQAAAALKAANPMGLTGLHNLGASSDKELAELARRERQNRMSLQLQGGAGGSGGIGFDLGIAQYDMNLAAISKEQRFRSDLRHTGATLGEDAARRSFGGDPLKFDQLYAQLVTGQSEQAKGNQYLRELLAQFKSGIPTYNLTKTPTKG
jgi:hypothetical protein